MLPPPFLKGIETINFYLPPTFLAIIISVLSRYIVHSSISLSIVKIVTGSSKIN